MNHLIRHPFLSTLAVAVAAALFLASAPAQAQGLLELYQSARSFDASYLAARAQADAAVPRAAQSLALRRPSAALSAGLTGSRIDTVASGTLSSTNTQAVLQARQPLFNRAADASIEQAQAQLDAAHADMEIAEQDLIARLTQAYFDVLAAQDTLATVQASKRAIAEQLASAKRNFEVGTATVTDTREAQARFDLAGAQEIAAENDLRTRRVALDQLVGRSDATPRPLLKPVVLPALLPDEVERWVADADARHPLVRKARIGEAVAGLETRKARAGHLPTVDLVASYSASRSSGSAIALSGAAGTTGTASIGVQLNVPLYSGHAIDNRIKETLLLENRAGLDLEASRRAVAQSTRQAFLGVKSGLAQVAALQAAEDSSQLALEATQLGYRVGVRVNLDVLNAQTQLFQTQRDLARARYDVLLGSLRLRQASGQLTADDVSAVSRLLAP